MDPRLQMGLVIGGSAAGGGLLAWFAKKFLENRAAQQATNVVGHVDFTRVGMPQQFIPPGQQQIAYHQGQQYGQQYGQQPVAQGVDPAQAAFGQLLFGAQKYATQMAEAEEQAKRQAAAQASQAIEAQADATAKALLRTMQAAGLVPKGNP